MVRWIINNVLKEADSPTAPLNADLLSEGISHKKNKVEHPWASMILAAIPPNTAQERTRGVWVIP